jgi:hypothetical protein
MTLYSGKELSHNDRQDESNSIEQCGVLTLNDASTNEGTVPNHNLWLFHISTSDIPFSVGTLTLLKCDMFRLIDSVSSEFGYGFERKSDGLMLSIMNAEEK